MKKSLEQGRREHEKYKREQKKGREPDVEINYRIQKFAGRDNEDELWLDISRERLGDVLLIGDLADRLLTDGDKQILDSTVNELYRRLPEITNAWHKRLSGEDESIN